MSWYHVKRIWYLFVEGQHSLRTIFSTTKGGDFFRFVLPPFLFSIVTQPIMPYMANHPHIHHIQSKQFFFYNIISLSNPIIIFYHHFTPGCRQLLIVEQESLELLCRSDAANITRTITIMTQWLQWNTPSTTCPVFVPHSVGIFLLLATPPVTCRCNHNHDYDHHQPSVTCI